MITGHPFSTSSQRNTPPLHTVGVVNYINTSQIMIPWHRLGGPEGWNVLESMPTQLNEFLKTGEIAVGLISSFAYAQGSEEYLLLPDLSISAAGPVQSVLFLHTRPIEGLDGVITTTHSATSVNLLHIILEEFWDISLPFSSGNIKDFDSSRGTKGYLAIGDEALRLATRHDLIKEDLAGIWMEKTGLPFVFAVWAVRRDVWEKDRERVLSLYFHIMRCRREGGAALEEISRLVAPRIPMAPSSCLDYLRAIQLDMGPEKQEGMVRYFSLLHRLGYLDTVPELEFVDI